MTDPETPDDWYAAVNLAEVLLAVESARLYGLLTGGPQVNVARCEQILADGATRGIRPTPEGQNAAIAALLSSHG